MGSVTKASCVALVLACGGRSGQLSSSGTSDGSHGGPWGADGAWLGDGAPPDLGPPPPVEECGNDADDDGDGLIDEECCDRGEWVSSMVDSEGDVGGYTTMKVDGADGIHVAYFDLGALDLRYAYRPSGGDWALEVLEAEGEVGRFASLAVDQANAPHVAYRHSTQGLLRYATQSNGRWEFSTVAEQPGNYGVGAYNSITVGRNGRVHIVYVVGEEEGALWYSRRDPLGSWVRERFATGTYPSIGVVGEGNAVDVVYSTADGLMHAWSYGTGDWWDESVDTDSTGTTSIAVFGEDLHVSYHESAARNLKYAHLERGNDWTTTQVEWDPDLGYRSSIALDVHGGVHISYYETTGRNLHYAYRKAGASWQTQTVVSKGWVGLYSAIDTDSNGSPNIVYYDVTHGDVVHVMCRR